MLLIRITSVLAKFKNPNFVKFVTCDMSVFFYGNSPVSSINKTDRHDITEILLKVVLNTKTLPINTILR